MVLTCVPYKVEKGSKEEEPLPASLATTRPAFDWDIRSAATDGIRWFYSRPPIVGIEDEKDLRGVRAELRIGWPGEPRSWRRVR